jgi:hypothetical protein
MSQVLCGRLITVINGMIIRHKKNRATILNEDMIPNSFNNSLLVMIVAKPAAVVKFVIKVAVPTFVITRLYFHEQHILVGIY